MSTKLYIGNLAWGTNTDRLREAFSAFGEVTDAIVMVDRESGRSRGFGFVTFSNEQQANDAVSRMNDQDLDGRRIRVALAAAREGGSTGGYSRGGDNGSSSGGYRRSPREY
jgi:cold-inducible RNA-binding protein